jgi:hypothetical protein
MAENPSLVLSLDASPTKSIDEKQQFDPCATATDVPIDGSARSITITSSSAHHLENPNSHHHDLSTLRLLTAHIGYVNFIYHILVS